jgi:hypothetical protein
MAALVQFDTAQSRGVAVFSIYKTGGDSPSEQFFHGLRHLRSGLSGANDVDILEFAQAIFPAACRQNTAADFRVAQNGFGGVRRSNRGAKDAQGLAAEGPRHGP